MESFGTAAIARQTGRGSVDVWVCTDIQRGEHLHACMAACLFERLQGLRLFLKMDTLLLDHISTFFSTDV